MARGYRRDGTAAHPPYLSPDYVATRTRSPARALVPVAHSPSEATGPVRVREAIDALEADLTRGDGREPVGERIRVGGRVLDEDGRPVRGTLVEIWQANAAGRYAHPVDDHPAPLDPNFGGAGRCVTDDRGGYEFVTIKPGAYPWGNHHNAWRPAHIHFSVLGPALATRLVTQMYFPGDPLFGQDPIFQSVRDPEARERLVSRFDLATTTPEWALGYRFDIVLRGRDATPAEDE